MKDISTSIIAYDCMLKRVEKIEKLENVSGRSIDELILFFSAGCKLAPPPVTIPKELEKFINDYYEALTKPTGYILSKEEIERILENSDTQCHNLMSTEET